MKKNRFIKELIIFSIGLLFIIGIDYLGNFNMWSYLAGILYVNIGNLVESWYR